VERHHGGGLVRKWGRRLGGLEKASFAWRTHFNLRSRSLEGVVMEIMWRLISLYNATSDFVREWAVS
jgi:hypothetical protein